MEIRWLHKPCKFVYVHTRNEDVMAENMGGTFIFGQGVSLLTVFLLVQLNSPPFPLIREHALSVHCPAHLQTSRS